MLTIKTPDTYLVNTNISVRIFFVRFVLNLTENITLSLIYFFQKIDFLMLFKKLLIMIKQPVKCIILIYVNNIISLKKLRYQSAFSTQNLNSQKSEIKFLMLAEDLPAKTYLCYFGTFFIPFRKKIGKVQLTCKTRK